MLEAKPDIQSETDIRTLVDGFYTQVRADEVLGPVFNAIIGDRWDEHFPRLYLFWESVLLGTAGYRGNAVQKHLDVNAKIPISEAHRDRWLSLWDATLAAHFEGSIANDAREKARSMMGLIFLKIGMQRDGMSLL